MLQENIKNQISMLEASKNFSKLTKMIDKDGLAVILENEKPKYVLLDYGSLQKSGLSVAAGQFDCQAIKHWLLAHIS